MLGNEIQKSTTSFPKLRSSQKWQIMLSSHFKLRYPMPNAWDNPMELIA